MEGTRMFTEKPESGKTVTKLGSSGDTKPVFTERPASYASKSPGPSASKMVPSIIGEDLTIRGNVTSKGEVQLEGEIEGEIRCGSLLGTGDGWGGRPGCGCARPYYRIDQGLACYPAGAMPCRRRHLSPRPYH